LVGNRYSLAARQRLAVARCACSTESQQSRLAREVSPSAVPNFELWLDGLNVLTGLEVALAGGIILVGYDGCCRDVAGLHRHYRKVEETLPALRLVGNCAASWGIKRCHWFLDKPVSNTGRVKTAILELATGNGWDWEVDLVYNPDDILSKTGQLVATGDSIILDRCQRWLNLVRHVIAEHISTARVLDLRPAG
jgi:hypothetical protein